MQEQPVIEPPRWAQRFLHWYCRPELAEDLEGDLHEYFLRNVERVGKRRARLIYILDVIKFFRPYTVRKPRPAMSNFTVLHNYLKTSTRNLYRNQLFSGINIIGLAIAMSVGLLLIAFLTELKSYDKFHRDYDRIYRVTNNYNRLNDEPSPYASTSVLAGRKIQEHATGIEAQAILRSFWDKDLKVGDKTVPMEGILADEGFFRVFSWDVIGGDPATALKELNSVVLTAKSAKNLFGTTDVVGKLVLVDTVHYTVTAVIENPPLHSHLRFDMVGSFITLDTKRLADKDKNWMKWDNMWQNYVYLKLLPGTDPASLEPVLARISEEGNKTLDHETITLALQPLGEIVLGKDMSNQIGPNFDARLSWILGGLAVIVILSACFNYTNLSIARALRRTREVGVRKAIGASRGQVMNQFLFESVFISLIALLLALGIFAFLRPGFISLDRVFNDLVTLRPDRETYLFFSLFAVGVGLLAGFLPALFFSRLNSAGILKDASRVKLFGHLGLRRALVVFQYTLSLGLIVAVSMGYRQYSYALAFDLGFTTEKIFNIELQGNNSETVMQAMAQVPGVTEVSRSMYVPSTGMSWTGNIRYKDPTDSAIVYFNQVDSAYIRVHHIELLAGHTFQPGPKTTARDAGIIINQKALHFMGLQDPQAALGEEVRIDGEPVTVIGVVRDFHHSTLHNPINNFAFRYYPPDLPARWGGVANLKVQTNNPQLLVSDLESAWKKIDPVHPFKGMFFEEKIQKAYDQLAGMLKIIGFLAFLAISIASLGLLGMVVFTTETRLKEISIRKVMGASEGTLVLLMSRGFMILLGVAAVIAIPLTYYLFDSVVFSDIAYRAPVGVMDLLGGSLVVFALALIAIGSQTLRVARVNPAMTLRNE